MYVSQRLKLHYLDWGNCDAPPLLLLHGGRDHCRTWDQVVAELRDDWHIITPDLRGHGDSEWVRSGHYGMDGFIYDLAELIEQQHLAPLALVGHSLGGNVCLRFSGLYSDCVRKLAAIEGLGPSPKLIAEEAATSVVDRMHRWIGEQRELARRVSRRYESIEEAHLRMQAMNPGLSTELAWHLTQHGVVKNADGTYSWKFDNHLRVPPPLDMTRAEVRELWGKIACPTMLVYGGRSWASNPQTDGRLAYFRNASVAVIDQAGHWVHHDRPLEFIALLRSFLAS
jgi:pimeloyl-ACP methyl ester carboxylesterase